MKFKQLLTVLLVVFLLTVSAVVPATALEPHGNNLWMRDWLVNSPDYTFSEAYMTSVWYENFRSLKLTGNDRNNVLRIAVSQLGYHEGNSMEDYDGMKHNGTRNYVEYARLPVNKHGFPYGEDEPVSEAHYEWCAGYVNWCISQAHVDYAFTEIGCWNWIELLRNGHMYEDSAAYHGTYTPQPADMIFFNWHPEQSENHHASHIGFVLYVRDGSVFTIEGNASDKVMIRSYPLDDPRVIGYGAVPYREEGEPTIDFSCRNGYPLGVYIVNTVSASLTKDRGEGRICRVPLGATVALLDADDTYAHVLYTNRQGTEREGYLPLRHLVLMNNIIENTKLVYDANGGSNPPAEQKISSYKDTVISDEIPTLSGDVFLGWSLTPYNCKVDYKPGESVPLMYDTILYAVWEKHSLELAQAAMAEGLIVDFNRPETIRNHRAWLLGTLDDLSAFTTLHDTDIHTVQDETLGSVLALSSKGASDDPYITLSCTDLLEQARLDPLQADGIRYIVLRVRDVSMNNLALELRYTCQVGNSDEMSGTVKKILAPEKGWQYAVFDMKEADGFNGIIRTLRLDWERAAVDANETMYLSDLYLARNDQELNALLNDRYIFPDQPLREKPETDTTPSSETDTPTDPEAGTASGTDGETGREDDTHAASGEKKGCASAFGTASLLIPLMLLPAVFRRRKDDR